jgi:hypothetical protein
MDEADISAVGARALDLLDTGHCRWTKGTAGPLADVPGTERCAIGLLACALDMDLEQVYLPPERALPAYDRLAEILTAMHPVVLAPSGFRVSVGQITTVNDTAASKDDIRAAFEKMRAG